jgi:pimeloyl-ACP methyl ester carboxylesterase
MRAKLPIKDGFIERDGIKLHYEIYGEGPETIFFIPPWSIVHSRVYKAQLPYFSERFRCVVYDGRGNGQSDRPADSEAYSLENNVADALAVMQETGTDEAILVGLSTGGMLACILAAYHGERVKAGVLVGTSASIGQGYPFFAPDHFTTPRDRFEGWDKYNRDYWQTNYSDFAEHFVGNIYSEPHSTKQIEDGLCWASRRRWSERLLLQRDFFIFHRPLVSVTRVAISPFPASCGSCILTSIFIGWRKTLSFGFLPPVVNVYILSAIASPASQGTSNWKLVSTI